jgi:hypothetical protein
MAAINNTSVGAIRVEASIDGGKFVDGAKKIRKESKQTEAQLKKDFSSMGAAVKGFGGALTAGLSIGLLGGLAKKALDYATAIKDVAKQVGVTTKELQEFRYAASQVGIKQTEADKGLEKLNLTLGKAAAGSKSAKEALAAVGVTMVDVKTKSNTQIFGQIADQMLKQGGAAKNAAAANAVFGESAAKLNPLLDQGSKGIDGLSDAANRLGIVLSDQQIQNADETARKLDDVKQVLAAQIAGVVTDNANSIVSLAQALGQLTSSIVNFLGSNPQAALGILGALAGGRVGGLPGAAAGGITGLFLGGRMDKSRRDSSSDIQLRMQEVKKAQAEFHRVSGLYGGQGTNKRQRDAARAEVQRQLGLLATTTAQVEARAAAARNPAGRGDIPQFLAPAPKAARGAKRTRQGPRDRSDDVAFQFDQELRRAQMDVLRAQQSLATSSDERARIALEILDAEREMKDAELKDRVRRAERDFAEGKITDSALEQAKIQADKLRSEYDDADALERKAIADEMAAQKARDAVELADSGRELSIELLQLEASLAETTSQRRDVELRILAAMKEQEKARLEAVIADQQSSQLARDQAQQRLNELSNIYAGREAVVRQSTRGPMESFRAEFGDITDEMEQLKVQGIMGAVDALGQLTDGFGSFKEAAVSAIRQVLQELIRLQLMKLAVGLLGGGGAPLPGFEGVAAGNMASLNAIPMNIPGMATGGGFRVRGIPGIDKNLLSLNGMPVARVSDMERVNVSNDNMGGGGRGGDTFNFTAPPGMSRREARPTGMAMARGMKEGLSYGVRGRR